MAAQTLEKTETAVTAKKTTAKPAKEQNDSKLRTGWRRPALKKESGRFSDVVWAGFFRSVVLLADYLLAFITATVVIPLLGVWLHQQSGASRGALSTDGTVAMWLMPLLFLVALLTAGEIVVMRGMWRWATRMIAKIRTGTDVTAKSTTRTTGQSGQSGQSRTDRRRSK
ncbi:hypothetical protein [Streptomyces acidiscabies]|uniref:RDD family protein n=1 Tax=Streptomyces acidiscabies TaxID=42234 RepID=A0ABU4LWU2_9ACTN|nr:hypothetical protein [Streptomyces acidiscabies]MDX3020148.1 hypothetical protein [Streptomyces acidiscabies]